MDTTEPAERESVNVLRECIDLQLAKSKDYQNPNSDVKQADHYLHGIDTIYDMLHQKMLRARSLLQAAATNPQESPKFESIEDTFKDIINYSSFAVSYLRGTMDGQNLSARDIFNRKRQIVTISGATTVSWKSDASSR